MCRNTIYVVPEECIYLLLSIFFNITMFCKLLHRRILHSFLLALIFTSILLFTVTDRRTITTNTKVRNVTNNYKHDYSKLPTVKIENSQLEIKSSKKRKQFAVNHSTYEELNGRAASNSSVRCQQRIDYLGLLNQTSYFKANYCDGSIILWFNQFHHTFRATEMYNFGFDFTFPPQARLQIRSTAHDGYVHDPRYVLRPEHVKCTCTESKKLTEADIFPMFMRYPNFPNDGQSEYVCAEGRDLSKVDEHLDGHTLVLTRKDDHNPYYMTSVALNAWVFMRFMQLTPDKVRLLILDDMNVLFARASKPLWSYLEGC